MLATCFEGRVLPYERFKNFAANIDLYPNAIRQPVNFNIPLPCGAVCGILASGKRNTPRSVLIDGAWDCCNDYNFLAVMGITEIETDLLSEEVWTSSM